MQEQLAHSHKFNFWLDNLKRNGLVVHGVEEIWTKARYNGEVLFSLVNLDASLPEGGKIPPVCFIKGQVVSILICLIDRQTKEKYLLLVRQRRICDGSFMYEQTAGMVDKDDAPLAVAVREVMEETGLRVSATDVIPLNTEPLYTSSGSCDEAMYFFFCEFEMEKPEIMSYHLRRQGVDYEHEAIVTEIVPIKDALKLIGNSNGLTNIYLYLQHKGDFSCLL